MTYLIIGGLVLLLIVLKGKRRPVYEELDDQQVQELRENGFSVTILDRTDDNLWYCEVI